MEDPITPRVHLYQLASFCGALNQALQRSGQEPEQVFAMWLASLSGDCAECGIQVSGEELFILSQPASPQQETPKIHRLRLGYCVRPGCKAYYYRISFMAHPAVDWARVLSEVETTREQQTRTSRGRNILGFRWQHLLRSGLSFRLGFALAMILLVLLIRQWRLGGRIPFLREPESFHVDPAPEGELAQ